MADAQLPAEGGLGTGRDEVQLRYRNDEAADAAQVTVDAFLAQDDAAAVRIEPGDNARDLLPHLARIRLVEVNFPTFADGRGYSAARLLREHGYTGELRAVGDVLVDQIAYMRRCGFDSFAPERPLEESDVQAALDRFPHDYQAAADAAVPIWKLRHG
ncbi:DUF934 domain-containing protein [Aurantiacibacter aquimixticola]|uniref:DUF934 domain-containing protein n=1 Tax=Aurantiacibacter aquimixticola TaxID=1958945 RepID=A0A419RT77_9SPHN|nr:DUF934 domain-containing protein [Aurantiacibacter aquimixticola]RJY08985.1 DUF934 domain-containing protein [Aurantiacibacter aquimixticola]